LLRDGGGKSNNKPFPDAKEVGLTGLFSLVCADTGVTSLLHLVIGGDSL
jgi:hypothetical protein